MAHISVKWWRCILSLCSTETKSAGGDVSHLPLGQSPCTMHCVSPNRGNPGTSLRGSPNYRCARYAIEHRAFTKTRP